MTRARIAAAYGNGLLLSAGAIPRRCVLIGVLANVKDAGAGALASRLEQEAQGALGSAVKELPPEAGEAIKGLGDLLGGREEKEKEDGD